MQHQEATVKRKKKSTLWWLAGLLLCLNVAIYYLFFIWPTSSVATKPMKFNQPDTLSAASTNRKQ
jgi:hypothetical protein